MRREWLALAVFFFIPSAYAAERASGTLEWYEARMKTLEDGVRLSCMEGRNSDERAGGARAKIAEETHKLANQTLERFKGDVTHLFQILADPEKEAQRRFQELARREQADAKDELITAKNDFAYVSSQPPRLLARVPASLLMTKRERLRSAQSRWDIASRMGSVTPEELKAQVRQEADQAGRELERLAKIGKRLDIAASRSRGCWAVAMGKTRLTYPFDRYELDKNFQNARAFRKEWEADNDPSRTGADAGQISPIQ